MLFRSNIVNQNGAVMTLSTQHTPLAPFALQIEAVDFHGLQAADSAQVVGSELYLGQWRIQTANAQIWNPVPDWASVRRAVTTDPDLLTLLKRQALTICPPDPITSTRMPGTPCSSAKISRAVAAPPGLTKLWPYTAAYLRISSAVYWPASSASAPASTVTVHPASQAALRAAACQIANTRAAAAAA